MNRTNRSRIRGMSMTRMFVFDKTTDRTNLYGQMFLTIVMLASAACSEIDTAGMRRQLKSAPNSAALAPASPTSSAATVYSDDFGCRGKGTGTGPKIGQTRIGNIFFESETIKFELPGNRTGVTLDVVDEHCTKVPFKESLADSASSTVVIDVFDRLGYFELHVLNGSTLLSKTSFARLRPFHTSEQTKARFGVNTVFGRDTNFDVSALTVVDRLGAIVRDGQRWDQFLTKEQYDASSKKEEYAETSDGHYVPVRFKEINDALASTLKMPSLYVLGLGHPTETGRTTRVVRNPDGSTQEWNTTRSPVTATQLNLFKAYVDRVVQGAVQTGQPKAAANKFEIWNEPDLSYLLDVCTSAITCEAEKVRAYRNICSVGSAAAKADGRRVLAACGAIAKPILLKGDGAYDVTSFAYKLVTSNAFQSADAFSFHTYPGTHEGIRLEEIAALRRLLTAKTNDAKFPIWVTEFGWKTLPYRADDTHAGVSELEQASRIVKSAIRLLSATVSKVWVYTLANVNENVAGAEKDKQRFFGITHSANATMGSYVPKPSYVAYANLIRMLNSFDYARGQNPTDSGPIEWHTFSDGSQTITVLWTKNRKSNVNAHPDLQVLVSAETDLEVTDMVGNRSVARANNGKISIRLTKGLPKFLSGKVRHIQAE